LSYHPQLAGFYANSVAGYAADIDTRAGDRITQGWAGGRLNSGLRQFLTSIKKPQSIAELRFLIFDSHP
jgi:hypothetical protein